MKSFRFERGIVRLTPRHGRGRLLRLSIFSRNHNVRAAAFPINAIKSIDFGIIAFRAASLSNIIAHVFSP